MTNVVKISPDSGEYPIPDFEVIAQSTKNISRLPFFKTDSMKALHEKAKIVADYTLGLNNLIGSELVSLSTKTGNLGLSDSFSTLTEIDNALAGRLDDDTAKAAKEARSETVAGISKALSGATSEFHTAAGNVAAKQSSISNIVIAQRTEGAVTQHESKHEDLVQQIAAKKAVQQDLEDQRDGIIKSQDVIREKNIADTFKDYIPDAKSLEKLDLKKPEVEAIKQGVELVKKVLGTVSEAIKYVDLANARKELDDKIDAATGDVSELKADLEANDNILDDLNNVMAVETNRTALLAETNKLPIAWTTFVEQIEHLSGSEITEAKITGMMDNMTTFLDACTKARNSVIIT